MRGISIFDIFKISIGPSSSHTLGPWKAAKDFVEHHGQNIDQVKIHLFGSLSKTGKGLRRNQNKGRSKPNVDGGFK